MATPRLISKGSEIFDLEIYPNDPLFKNSYPTAYLITEKFEFEQLRLLMNELSVNVTDYKNRFIFETILKKPGEHKFQAITLFTFSLFVAKTHNVKMFLNQANWLHHNMQKAITGTSKSVYENNDFRKAKKGLTLSVPSQHALFQAGFSIKPTENEIHLDDNALSTLMHALQSFTGNQKKAAGG